MKTALSLNFELIVTTRLNLSWQFKCLTFSTTSREPSHTTSAFCTAGGTTMKNFPDETIEVPWFLISTGAFLKLITLQEVPFPLT